MKKILTFLKKNWGWIIVVVFGLVLYFWGRNIWGLILSALGLAGGGLSKLIKKQEKIIENSNKKIDEHKAYLDKLTRKEKKRLKELEDAKKHVDDMSISDLVDWGNKRPGRNIRRGK